MMMMSIMTMMISVFHFLLFLFFFIKIVCLGTRLNATNATGLDEYVDILQVQQLLLDSSVTPLTNSASAATSTARHRPRVNIQKASEYSSGTTTAQVQGEIGQEKYCLVLLPFFSSLRRSKQ